MALLAILDLKDDPHVFDVVLERKTITCVIHPVTSVDMSCRLSGVYALIDDMALVLCRY